MNRCAVLLLAVCLVPAFAADKTPAKPVGTWTRDAGGNLITFTFNADSTYKLKVTLDSGNEAEVEGNYGITADGTVFAIMTKASSSVDNGPEKGDLFRFTFKVEGKELTLGDLDGTRINDDARRLVEGSYAKK
jgi:hypothetical protein